jgi:hypothetical protein
MTQEIINIGTLPNDGTGDPLRVAYGKINNNFSTLFSTSIKTAESETTNSNPDQVIWEIPSTQFTQGQFQVLSSNPTTNDSQSITISAHLTYDQDDVKWTGYATTFNGTPVTTYNMAVVGGNVQLLVTPLVSLSLSHFITTTVQVES